MAALGGVMRCHLLCPISGSLAGLFWSIYARKYDGSSPKILVSLIMSLGCEG